MKAISLPLLSFAIILGVASLTPRFSDASASCDSVEVPLYVVNHGYHTSLVVPARFDTFDWRKPLNMDSTVQYIEFAWGDRSFYTSSQATFKNVTHALFWPSPSVMHVVGVQSPSRFFASEEIDRLEVCSAKMNQLYEYIRESFQPQFQYLQSGLYGQSAFYEARMNYHFLYNCNNWTAGALRQLGVSTPLWSGLAPTVFLYLPEN